MRTAIRALWNRVWFEAVPPLEMRVVRVVLAVHSIWILLSRPDLTALTGWPSFMFEGVEPGFAARFGLLLLPASVERALYFLLLGLLVLVAFGVGSRWTMLASGLLLYHFGPLEEILTNAPHAFFGGLTLPTLGLLILGFAKVPDRNSARSPEWRWPVALIQLLLLLNYFFASVAKIGYSGVRWFTAENIRHWLIVRAARPDDQWWEALARSEVLQWAIAIGTAILEFGAPLAMLHPALRTLFAVVAFGGHVAIAYGMGISFPSLPLLLILPDWNGLAERLRFRRRGASVARATAPS